MTVTVGVGSPWESPNGIADKGSKEISFRCNYFFWTEGGFDLSEPFLAFCHKHGFFFFFLIHFQRAIEQETYVVKIMNGEWKLVA